MGHSHKQSHIVTISSKEVGGSKLHQAIAELIRYIRSPPTQNGWQDFNATRCVLDRGFDASHLVCFQIPTYYIISDFKTPENKTEFMFCILNTKLANAE